MTPVFRIFADKQNITSAIAEDLVSIRHHDQRGHESDTLEIIINDDHSIALPRKGVKLTLQLGYKGGALVDRGEFTADEVHQDGGIDGDKITLSCKAADMRQSLKSQKTRSWDNTTLGDVISDIATSHGLTPRINERLSQIKILHLDQTGESDINLVTRLALTHNAIGKVANGHLAFVDKGEGKTASGAVLAETTIQRSDGDTHHYEVPDRDNHGTIEVLWRNSNTGKQHKATAGSGEPIKQLKNKVHGSLTDAQEAADGEYRRFSKKLERFNVNKAVADPTLFAEMPIVAEDYRQEIDGSGWFIESIDTVLEAGDSGGMYQEMQLERGKAEE